MFQRDMIHFPMDTWSTSLTLIRFLILTLIFSYTSYAHSILDKTESDLQKIFRLRTEDEWKSAWHSEKHIRCRNQLVSHMDFACQKDVYRLNKKSIPSVASPLHLFIPERVAVTLLKPWSGYIRRKRENKSITDECCSANGCTWEEYAEYCPAHRRLRLTRSQI